MSFAVPRWCHVVVLGALLVLLALSSNVNFAHAASRTVHATRATPPSSPFAAGIASTSTDPATGITTIQLANCIATTPSNGVLDHATFSDADLQKYGMPLPEFFPGGRSDQNWLRAVRAQRSRACTVFQNPHLAASSTPVQTSGPLSEQSIYYSWIWNGYVMYGSSWQMVQSNWTFVNAVNQQLTESVVTWVGIGGYRTPYLVQAGAFNTTWDNGMLGWETDHNLFYENFGNQPGKPGYDSRFNNEPYYGPSPNIGDPLYAFVSGNSMYSEDQLTGQSISESFGPNGLTTMGDCISERPAGDWYKQHDPITFSNCEMADGSYNWFFMGDPYHTYRPFIASSTSTSAGTPCSSLSGVNATYGTFTVYWNDRCTNSPNTGFLDP